MNKGIEILLERMKSNPEEFISEANYGESKWSAMVSYFKGFLDEEEVKTLMDAWQENTKKVMQERFTQQVMKELLDPKSEDGVSLYNITHPSATRLGGATLGAYSNTATVTATNAITTGTWGTSSIEQTLARLEEIKKEYDKPKPKRWWNKSIPELLGTK